MNNLDPLALFQQYKSGVPFSQLMGQQSYQRPTQILPQALPTIDYNALYRQAHPAPVRTMFGGMPMDMSGEGNSGNDGSAAAAASAANGDAVGGIGGGGGGAGGK